MYLRGYESNKVIITFKEKLRMFLPWSKKCRWHFFRFFTVEKSRERRNFFCDTGNLNSSLQEDNLFEKKDVFATFSLFFFFTYLFHSALEGTKQNSLSPSFFSIIKDVRERRKIQLNHLKKKGFHFSTLGYSVSKLQGFSYPGFTLCILKVI